MSETSEQSYISGSVAMKMIVRIFCWPNTEHISKNDSLLQILKQKPVPNKPRTNERRFSTGMSSPLFLCAWRISIFACSARSLFRQIMYTFAFCGDEVPQHCVFACAANKMNTKRTRTFDERYFVSSLPIPLLAPVTTNTFPVRSTVVRRSGLGYLALCFCHPVLVKCFFPYLR